MLNNKKKNAFTITELVIVIAVIAILAAVLIPTFSTVVDNAKKSAAMQEARNAMTNYTSDKLIANAEIGNIVFVVDGTFYFTYIDGEFSTTATTAETLGATYTIGSDNLNAGNAYGESITIYTLTAK